MRTLKTLLVVLVLALTLGGASAAQSVAPDEGVAQFSGSGGSQIGSLPDGRPYIANRYLMLVADPASALETSWKGADGLMHKVVTPKKTSETNGQWAGRHANEVRDALIMFPPVPSTPGQ